MSLRNQEELFRVDLRMFDETPQSVAPAPAEPAPVQPVAPAQVDPPSQEPPSLDEPLADEEKDLLSPDILIQRVLGQKVPPLPTPPVPGDKPVASSSPAGPTPPAPQAAQQSQGDTQQAAPTQTQQPIVGIPAELLTVLGQLANKALPEPKAPAPPPEPELPPLPQEPEILQGTPEEQEQKYMENPLAFNRAMMQHELATQRVQAERARITAEHKAKIETSRRSEAFTQAFVKQIQSLGKDVFEKRAPLAEQMLSKDMPYLLRLPPEQAVEAAFKVVADREAPKPVDPQSLTQEQKTALKAALQQEIIQEYLAGVAAGKTPPQVISGAIGAGKTPLTPGHKPEDLDQAEASFLRRYGRS